MAQVTQNGDIAHLQFTVKNEGTDPATGVSVAITAPAGLSYQTGTFQITKGSFNESTLVWDGFTLAVNEERVIKLDFKVTDITQAPFDVEAEISGTNTDSDASDNTVTKTITVTTCPPVAGAVGEDPACVCGDLSVIDTACSHGTTSWKVDPTSYTNIDTLAFDESTGKYRITYDDATQSASFQYAVWCDDGSGAVEVSGPATITASPLFASAPNSTEIVDNGNRTYTVTPPSGSPFTIEASRVEIDDTTTLDLTISGNGSVASPYNISGDVIVDPRADNLLDVSAGNGVYVKFGFDDTTTPGYVNLVTASTSYSFKTGWTEVAYSAPNLTFTYPDGSTTDIDLVSVIESLEVVTSISNIGANTIAYVDEDGNTTNIDIGAMALNVIQASNLSELSDVPAYPNDANTYYLKELNGVLSWELYKNTKVQSFSIEEQGTGTSDDVLRITDTDGNNFDIFIQDLADAIDTVASSDTTNVSLVLAGTTLTLTDSAGDTVSEDLDPILTAVEGDVSTLQGDVATLQSDVSNLDDADIDTASFADNGDGTKTLTINLKGGGTVTATFTDNAGSGSSVQVSNYEVTGTNLRITESNGDTHDVALSAIVSAIFSNTLWSVSSDADNIATIGADGKVYVPDTNVDTDTDVSSFTLVDTGGGTYVLRITESNGDTHDLALADIESQLALNSDSISLTVGGVPDSVSDDPLWIVSPKYNGWTVDEIKLQTNFTGTLNIKDPAASTVGVPVTANTLATASVSIALSTNDVFEYSIAASNLATENAISVTFVLSK